RRPCGQGAGRIGALKQGIPGVVVERCEGTQRAALPWDGWDVYNSTLLGKRIKARGWAGGSGGPRHLGARWITTTYPVIRPPKLYFSSLPRVAAGVALNCRQRRPETYPNKRRPGAST